MPAFTIHLVPRPASLDDQPHPLLLGASAVQLAVERALYGHGDFADSVRARMVHQLGSAYERRTYWVALPAGVSPDEAAADQALGVASAATPLQEDTATAVVDVSVHPDHRSCGLGRALLDAVAAHLLAEGRTLWQAYTFSPGPRATGPDALRPLDGPGAVDADLPWHRFLVAEGWRLELCERPSTLTITPDALARAASLAAEAASRAGAYRLESWQGPTPASLAPGVARIMERMVSDAPSGGMQFDAQTWTPERLAGLEGRLRGAGQDLLSTVALDPSSGELAGLTRFVWPEQNPAGIWQEETLVLPHHRGHRLGLVMKAANLARLVEVNPDARRIHTWNAVENGPMLAINEALGFVETGVEGSWQKRWDAAR